MGTRQENAEKRDANVLKMEEQLRVWSTQIDELVVGCIKAGAQTNDAYRIRVDALRARQEAVQSKFNEFRDPAGHGGAWGTYRTAVAEDWKALDAGLKDPTH